MDIKVDENDIRRILEVIDTLQNSATNKSLENEIDTDFIDYFKLKYKQLPFLRKQKSMYYEFSKKLYDQNKEDPQAKAAYKEYCSLKLQVEKATQQLKGLAKKNFYL